MLLLGVLGLLRVEGGVKMENSLLRGELTVAESNLPPLSNPFQVHSLERFLPIPLARGAEATWRGLEGVQWKYLKIPLETTLQIMALWNVGTCLGSKVEENIRKLKTGVFIREARFLRSMNWNELGIRSEIGGKSGTRWTFLLICILRNRV